MTTLTRNPLADLLRGFFAALDGTGISFVILRNYDGLPYTTTNDIDILVSPDRRTDAEILLAKAAIACGWRVHNRARFSPVCLFLHHLESRQQVQIDLFTRLEWRGIEIIPADHVLANKREHGGIPIPDPGHEALLNLTGRLLPYGYVREKYQQGIAEVARSGARTFESAASNLFGISLAKEITAACAKADWESLERMHKRLRRAAVLHRPLHALAGATSLAWRLAKRFVCPPGMWIVFLGPDGSGKSTCLDNCAGALEGTFSPGKSRKIHWKPVPFRKHAVATGVTNTNPHAKPPRPFFLSLPYLVYHWTQFVLGHWTVVRPVLFRNGCVYFDRHYADFLVDPKRFRLSVPAGIIRIFGWFVPRPDLVLVFAAEPETLLARKAEVSPDECRRQVGAYRDLAHGIRQAHLINAGATPVEVAWEATGKILAFLADRLERRHPHLAVTGSKGEALPASFTPLKPRVLLSAYACEPGRGSEPGVGWNIARVLSCDTRLTVVTRANNRSVIEASAEPWVREVNWWYYDPPASMTWWKKKNRGVQLYYILWQIGCYRLVRQRLRAVDFDIIHHITFGKFWIPSLLARLPAPFVFGPVGGGEETPPDIAPTRKISERIEGMVKSIVQRAICRLPGIGSLYRDAAWTYAATTQTLDKLKALGVARVSVLPQSGIECDLADRFGISRLAKTAGGPIRFVTAARLVGWKAIDLALDAFARLPASLDAELVVLQEGPELDTLRQMAQALGIGSRVRFTGRLPTLGDVYQEMADADALVHPALHEAFGQACVESLALGVPVIALDWGGPGLIVDDTCGIKVKPGNREETIQRLSDAMVVIVNAAKGMHPGFSPERCKARARESFSWEFLGTAITNGYKAALRVGHQQRVLLQSSTTSQHQ